MAKAFVFIFALLAQPALADVGFKVLTDKGYVSFATGDDWRVISMQSKLPVATAAFQLPNAADEGTPHSTNIIFKFYQHGSQEAAESLGKVGKQYGSVHPRNEKFEEWVIYRQQAPQNGVQYTILDAKRELTSVAASVRLAWPHLPSNAKGYDQAMEEKFRAAAKSVSEHVGPYTPGPDEVIRRPSQ